MYMHANELPYEGARDYNIVILRPRRAAPPFRRRRVHIIIIIIIAYIIFRDVRPRVMLYGARSVFSCFGPPPLCPQSISKYRTH